MIEGKISVKAAISGGRREVDRIWMDKSLEDRDSRYIRRIAEDKGIPVELVTRPEITEKAEGKTHGGILAEVSSRRYDCLEDCLNVDIPFAAVLEGVEDPFNLGYVMRTLYSAGCSGLLVRKRDWSMAEQTILRSSAGAFDLMNVIMSKDLCRDVHELREHGLTCYAAMRRDAVVYDQADYKKPVILMIGGEMRGLSSGLLREADQNIYIPYANDFRNALNAAGAAAVLAFEVFRQRREG